MGEKKSKIFFCFSYALKMILNGFWTCFGIFWFSRLANPLHESMCKVWAKKSQKIYFVSYALKMILNGFWTCFGDYCFSRSPNPLHDSMYKVWGEKSQNFFLFFLCFKNDFKWVLDVFWDLLVFEVGKSVT
jgi:hypothetical protein